MPDAPAKQLILTKCVSCHTLDRAIDTRTLRIEANRSQWEEVMGTHMYYMEDRPQTMSYEEKSMIIDYMTKYFTQGAEADAPRREPAVGKEAARPVYGIRLRKERLGMADLNCPKCGATAVTGHSLFADSAIVNSCRTCRGVWVAANVFQELLRQADPEGSEIGATKRAVRKRSGKHRSRAPAKPLAVKEPARQGKPAYLPCPVCHALMARQNFAHRSGVKVHVCRQHGVWFDDEETLEDLVGWVKSGGLAATREEQQAGESHNERIKARLARERLDGSFDSAEEWPF